jgi:hypothetical protein
VKSQKIDFVYNATPFSGGNHDYIRKIAIDAFLMEVLWSPELSHKFVDRSGKLGHTSDHGRGSLFEFDGLPI